MIARFVVALLGIWMFVLGTMVFTKGLIARDRALSEQSLRDTSERIADLLKEKRGTNWTQTDDVMVDAYGTEWTSELNAEKWVTLRQIAASTKP